jgi:hypothetical protein
MAKGFQVTIENGAYVVSFPYDPGAVAMLKQRIPNTDRSWDGTRKCWIIAGSQKKNAEIALGMTFPDMVVKVPVAEMRLLEVRYLGQCKERELFGKPSAMGLLKNGQWGAIFSQAVLQAWFEDGGSTGSQVQDAATLYAILGAKQTDDEQAIKKAYFRMAKQWHPDVCKEPGANDVFLRIREAYDILRVPRSRGRYDAGLALEASINKPDKSISYNSDQSNYRSPLRCGWIMAEGVESIGRFVVSKIIGWEDITDAQGRVLVSSWKKDDKVPTEVWA